VLLTRLLRKLLCALVILPQRILRVLVVDLMAAQFSCRLLVERLLIPHKYMLLSL